MAEQGKNRRQYQDIDKNFPAVQAAKRPFRCFKAAFLFLRPFLVKFTTCGGTPFANIPILAAEIALHLANFPQECFAGFK